MSNQFYTHYQERKERKKESLTKPITVDGYNEGVKEFVPIVELARIGTGHAINEGYELGETGVIKWSRYYFWY